MSYRKSRLLIPVHWISLTIDWWTRPCAEGKEKSLGPACMHERHMHADPAQWMKRIGAGIMGRTFCETRQAVVIQNTAGLTVSVAFGRSIRRQPRGAPKHVVGMLFMLALGDSYNLSWRPVRVPVQRRRGSTPRSKVRLPDRNLAISVKHKDCAFTIDHGFQFQTASNVYIERLLLEAALTVQSRVSVRQAAWVD